MIYPPLQVCISGTGWNVSGDTELWLTADELLYFYCYSRGEVKKWRNYQYFGEISQLSDGLYLFGWKCLCFAIIGLWNCYFMYMDMEDSSEFCVITRSSFCYRRFRHDSYKEDICKSLYPVIG